ncbi:uncharacterized protein [Cicer arietinum]|uniref:uncharacterized protein n=1 Tax=Cicer arietinum TaxID=3827 RepID=UPI003CC5822A
MVRFAQASSKRFYLKALLNYVRELESYEDIKTMDNVVYKTFKETCFYRSLLNGDKKYMMQSSWGARFYSRKLFATLLMSDQMIRLVFSRSKHGNIVLCVCGTRIDRRRSMSTTFRSKGDIVLTTVSSGIAALVSLGGRTAHSRFSIPLEVDEYSICSTTQNFPLAMDNAFRDVIRDHKGKKLDIPFGGKVVVFTRDFRQILFVIPKATKQDVVHAIINSSYHWIFCEVVTLHADMRLLHGSSEAKVA